MIDYKVCVNCKEKKQIENFCKANGYKDGFQNECKKCRRKKSQLFKKTKNGVIHSIYDGQKNSSKRRGINPPSYTKKWLEKWLLLNPEFHRLYDIWVISGYDTDFKPSVDRLDDYIGYTEYNIQLTTWGKNREKSYFFRKTGKNNKTNKSVSKYNIDNIHICDYFSIAEAGRRNNVDYRAVSDCCRKKIKSVNGFIYKYKKE